MFRDLELIIQLTIDIERSKILSLDYSLIFLNTTLKQWLVTDLLF